MTPTMRGIDDRVRTPCEAALDVAVQIIELAEERFAAACLLIAGGGPEYTNAAFVMQRSAERCREALDKIETIYPEAVKP